MGAHAEYTAVAMEQTPVAETPKPTTEESLVMAKASRWVVALCFLQLGLAIASVSITGMFWWMLLSTVFVFCGLNGASRYRVRPLIAHFVYSLILYILSLVSMFTSIMYCEHCNILFFAVCFVIVLIQAVGLRHSRILIALARKYDTGCKYSCKRSCSKQEAAPVVATTTQTETPVEAVTQTSEVPTYVPPMYPMMSLPPHMQMQMMQMQMANNGNAAGAMPYPMGLYGVPSYMPHPVYAQPIAPPQPSNN